MIFHPSVILPVFSVAAFIILQSANSQELPTFSEIDTIPIDQLVESVTGDDVMPVEELYEPMKVTPIQSPPEPSTLSVEEIYSLRSEAARRYQSMLETKAAVARQWYDRADEVLQSWPPEGAQPASPSPRPAVSAPATPKVGSAVVKPVNTAARPATAAQAPMVPQRVSVQRPTVGPPLPPGAVIVSERVVSSKIIDGPCCQQLRQIRGSLGEMIIQIEEVVQP